MQLRNTQHDSAIARAMGDLAPLLGVPPEVAAAVQLDYRLACPGATANRSQLLGTLVPPLIRFPGGEQWLLGEVIRRTLIPHVTEEERRRSAELEHVAEAVSALDVRWRRFAKASVRQGLPCRGPAP